MLGSLVMHTRCSYGGGSIQKPATLRVWRPDRAGAFVEPQGHLYYLVRFVLLWRWDLSVLVRWGVLQLPSCRNLCTLGQIEDIAGRKDARFRIGSCEPLQ